MGKGNITDIELLKKQDHLALLYAGIKQKVAIQIFFCEYSKSVGSR